MRYSVDELLSRSFSHRTIEEKIQIISGGKPRPLLNKSSVTFRETDGVVQTREFDPKLYDHVQWLTACEKRECFFCWPCLLFMPPDLWNRTGIFDFGLLIESLPKHNKSPEHAQANLHFQFFTKQHMKTNPKLPEPQTDYKQFNECVYGNRQILKRLVDSICYVVMKDIPPHSRSDCFHIKTEDCIKALKLIQIHDDQRTNYADDAIELINASPNIISDLVDVITNMVKLEIKKEIRSSTYVSLILTEHTCVAAKPQISTFLRYIKDGRVCEKFVGFTNMPDSMCPFKILMHVSKIVEEFGIVDKLTAQALDGTMLEISVLYEVIEMLKTNYPFSYFVPCYYHGLQQVLKQNLSEFKECGLFFKNLTAMEIYFQNTKLAKEFEIFMFGNVPNFRNKKWQSSSEFIKILSTCRVHFVQFFDSVIQNTKRWTGHQIIKAFCFLQFLKNFQNVFLLHALSKLLEYTETLDAKLKSHSPESAFNIAVVVSVITDLTRERDEGFEKFWYGAIRDLESEKEPASKRIKLESDTEMQYQELYSNIIDRIIYEIKCRFASLDSLEFFRLLSNVGELLAQNSDGELTVLSDCLQKLLETQHRFFDETQMQNEFKVLTSYKSVISEKSVYDWLEYFTETDSKLIFKNLNRLAELILTLPLMPPVQQGGDSKIEKVRKLSYIPNNNVSSGDASVLCVEFDTIHELRKNVLFYDEVISGFYDVNKTIELMHKTE